MSSDFFTHYPVRLLVTGGRSIPQACKDELVQALDRFLAEHPNMALAHGACPHPKPVWDETRLCWLPRTWYSADTVADNWAWSRWPRPVMVYPYPADWKTHGRAAGPKRNEFMVKSFRPTHVLVAPGGRGTADCVARALKSGAVRV